MQTTPNFEMFGITLPKGKANLAPELKSLVNGRVKKIDSFMQKPTQGKAEKIATDTATILAFCKAHKLQTNNTVLVDGINSLIHNTLTNKENVMKAVTPRKKAIKTKPPVTSSTEETKKSPVEKATKKVEVQKNTKAETKKAKTAKQAPAKVAETPKTAPVRASESEQITKPAAEFTSPCSGEFDPDPTSSCFCMCKEETPDDFNSCVKHYQEMIDSKSERRRASTTKNRLGGTKKKSYDFIGDGVGTSAHMINVLLIEGATLAEIAEIVPTKKTRITGHFSGLRTGNTRRAPKTLVKDAEDRWKFEQDGTVPANYLGL
jgi:hypothetical protein